MRADWIRLMIAAARLPLRSDPANNGRSAADHVEHRYRLGGEAVHRRADGGRDGCLHHSYPDCYLAIYTLVKRRGLARIAS